MSTSGSVVRALRILELLSAPDGESAMTATTVAQTLDMPVSTAHGILAVLVDEGFVRPTSGTGYAMGVRAFEVGAGYLRTVGVVGLVAPELARLTQRVRATSHWAVLDGYDAVYLCKEEPPGLGVRLASSVGARLPSHVTAVGKSCLAWLDWPRAAQHVRPDAERTGGGLIGLQAELERVRAAGYSVDDGATAAGVVCVAAPVFDPSGPRGAIGVSFLRDVDTAVDRISAEVQDAAARATASLGGKESR